MFGAETLKRKYGMTPTKEWVEVIGRLKDYELTRGMRRLVASGSENLPSLPKFRRLCQESLNDDTDTPTATPLPQLPSNLASQDAWDIASNRHLLQHLNARLGRDSKCYGPVMPGYGGASPEQEAASAVLVKWKKHWAQMMREEATAEGVDGKYQREVWDSYMRMAEEEIKTGVSALASKMPQPAAAPAWEADVE